MVPVLLVESALRRKSLFNSRVDWGGSTDFKGGRPVTFEVSRGIGIALVKRTEVG